MPKKTIAMPYWFCHRCKEAWVGRIKKKPKRCPRCGSPNWETKRRIKKHLLIGTLIIEGDKKSSE